MRRRWQGTALLAVVLGATAVTPSSAGELADLATVDDGTYVGRLVVAGTFGLDAGRAGVEGALTWTGRSVGPAELVVVGGMASGAWSGTTTGTIDGRFSDGANDVVVRGTQDGSWSGTFAGTGGDYRMVGSDQTTTTVTIELPVDVPGLDQSHTRTSSTQFEIPLSDLLVTCGQLVASLDRTIRENLQGVGLDHDLSGSLVLVRHPVADETDAALTRLQGQLEAGLRDIHRADDAFVAGGVGQLFLALEAAADVVATLREPSPCPASQQAYLELAADIARQALRGILTAEQRGVHVPTSLYWDALTAAVAAGLTTTPGGAELVDGVRAVITERWVAESTADGFDLSEPSDEVVTIVVMAACFFWDLPLPDGTVVPAEELLGGGS